MGRIKGHYEWDDDDLTPGQKKEGGLHQNLFDQDGKLKGSARFVPDDGDDGEPLVVTETVFVHIDDRWEAESAAERDEVLARLALAIAAWGVTTAAPAIRRWWSESGRSALADRWDHRPRLRRRRSQNDEETGEPMSEVIVAPADRPRMSRAEAQARYVAALAARAYSEEQMKIVSEADLVDGGGVASVQRELSMLDTADLAGLLRSMSTNPQLLTEDALADLASVLGRHVPSPAPLSERQGRPPQIPSSDTSAAGLSDDVS